MSRVAAMAGFVAIAASLAACTSSPGQESVGTVNGRVMLCGPTRLCDRSASPVPGVNVVLLESPRTVVGSGRSDAEGRFSIDVAAGGPYTVRAKRLADSTLSCFADPVLVTQGDSVNVTLACLESAG